MFTRMSTIECRWSVCPLLAIVCIAGCGASNQQSASQQAPLGLVDRPAEVAQVSSPDAEETPELSTDDPEGMVTLRLSATTTEGTIEYRRQRLRYALAIASPRTVTITVSGRGLDPTVAIVDDAGRRLAFDDDSGEGTDARLTRSLEPGSYVIEVAGFRASTGDFSLEVR